MGVPANVVTVGWGMSVGHVKTGDPASGVPAHANAAMIMKTGAIRTYIERANILRRASAKVTSSFILFLSSLGD
jgi:hypothetical protein